MRGSHPKYNTSWPPCQGPTSLWKAYWFSERYSYLCFKAWPVWENPNQAYPLTQVPIVSVRGPIALWEVNLSVRGPSLCKRSSFSVRGQASLWEARPLCERSCISNRVPTFLCEARPLMWEIRLSVTVLAFLWEAGPLQERLGLPER